MEEKEKYKMKRQLKELGRIKGSGTELISVYISPGYPIHEMGNKLKEESGQAANIKSKRTRKNVLDALEKIINYLKMFRKPPSSGIAIFCGNISNVPGRPDIKLFSIVPYEPINVQMYRCDSRFFLEPLEALIEVKDSYGLVVLDGREATVGLLRGTNFRILRRIRSLAHGKMKAGGQSARRFARLREEAIEKYYKRVGAVMDSSFIKGVKGVIVGGPGPTKDYFLKERPFNYQIKILGPVDTGYVDEYGIKELVTNSSSLIAGQEAVLEKKLIDRFIREVVTGGLATYGEKEVREALLTKKAGTLLISEGLDYKRVKLSCRSCGKEKEVTAKEEKAMKCECGGTMKVISEKPLIDDLMDIASEIGIDVEVISTETSEGAQFLNSFYGIGAFLRYK